MAQIAHWFSARLNSLIRGEKGADAIEYLLTIAVICVAVVAGVASGLPASWLLAILAGVCKAVNTAFPALGMTC